ncbi:MAG TPA: Slp family lipoprotein [Candidatus Wunengus sp. YC60]|uniref:Slp family lipoprotein n=1 Tax=Candidatus Wunengus sp. YC60 TaxID=3367697 RepID=UPI00402610B8
MAKSATHFIISRSMPIVLLLSLAGCAPVISKQIREQVKPDLTFREVLNDPEHYKGQMVVLSGVIIETKNTKEGTLLIILQRPAGFRGQPKDVDESEGRFLALDSRYLDANVFAKGRAVTVGGEIQEKRVLPSDEIEYAYPLIYVKEIYLWPVVEKRYYSPYYPYYRSSLLWRSRLHCVPHKKKSSK